MAEIHIRRNNLRDTSIAVASTAPGDLQRALTQGNRDELYARLSTFGITTFARLEGALGSPYELAHFSPNTVSYLRDLVLNRQRVCKRVRSVADPVYGSITFTNDIWEAVIDTKPFQRLRNLKQVGVASYVYPSAVHARFEHCLGVGHLAGEWFSKLHNSCYPRQSSNAFEWESVKTGLQIAGLCHDLGHGPFSHAYEVFVHNYHPSWHHEDMSVALFEYLCDTGPLGHLMDDLGGAVSRRDISDMILGVRNDSPVVQTYTPEKSVEIVRPSQLGWATTSFGPELRRDTDDPTAVSMNESPHSPSLGTPTRSPSASYGCCYKIDDDKFRRGVFSVIHNADTGFDVDRMDYLTRDVTIAPGLPRVNIGRLMNNSTVSQEGKIVFDLKCQSDVFAFYRTRFDMFNNVYLHKNCIAIELMLVDVLKIMEPVYKLADAIYSIEDFLNLSDGVLLEWFNCLRRLHGRAVELSDEHYGRYLEAGELIARIERRQLYTYTGVISPKSNSVNLSEIKEEDIVACCSGVELDDLVLYRVKSHHGAPLGNPWKSVSFYHNSRDICCSLPEAEWSKYPIEWERRCIMVYCRRDNPVVWARICDGVRYYCSGRSGSGQRASMSSGDLLEFSPHRETKDARVIANRFDRTPSRRTPKPF